MTADFLSFAENANWYHSMKIHGYRTQGRFPSGVQNRTLLGVFDMLNRVNAENLSCLDIGTVDGITAFALKQRGASYVVGTDRVTRPTFGAAREALNLDVEHIAGLELSGMLERFGKGRFDLIVCAGVIYHMLNPFTAFQICRQLLRPGGLLFMESACDHKSQGAVMTLNSEDTQFDETATYWIPTPSSIEGMMKLAGFDVLDRRRQKALRRFACVGRAVSPQQISNRTPMLQAMQAQGYVDNDFTSKSMEGPGPDSKIVAYDATGAKEDMTLDDENKVTFSLHPTPGIDDGIPIIGDRHKWTKVADVLQPNAG